MQFKLKELLGNAEEMTGISDTAISIMMMIKMTIVIKQLHL